MTYFDKILKKRDLETAPLPLWKLNITDEEYQELKEELRQLTLRHRNNCDNPFICRTRECTLFYAEYWRREYYDGVHSKQVVYDALESPYYNPDNCENFYQAAKRGAKRLKIELYADEGRTQHLDSMFYQGGLPMRLVTDGNQNSTWDRFVRGLVNRNVNFDELHLGVIASNSNSMKEFCDWIIRALDAKQFMLMPFYCKDELNSWYTYLQELKEEESHRQRLSRPFSLDWEFRIDNVGKKIYTKFVVTGRQCLPQSFIDDNNISNPNFFSALVYINGKVTDSFDYVHNFCRYTVISRHTYHTGDSISVHVSDDTSSIITEDLDMSVPHLMYKNNEGKYELGNRIGRQTSFLLIPEGWNVEECHELSIEQYEYEDTVYDGIMIPEDFEDEITIKSEDGVLTFGCNTTLYWTELSSIPVYTPNIVEPLYDVSKAHFTLCNDFGDGVRKNRNARVEYCSKRDNEWTMEPMYGEIFARSIDANGHFVTPVKFINVGEGVKVNVVSADDKTCKIQVAWQHGRVTTTEGEKQANDVWEVNKENITGNKIRFTLIPDGNSNNQFNIQIKAPFKEFAIFDTNGHAISSDYWIPFSDIDKFEYHLIGQDIREYTFGSHHRQLRWRNENLYVEENGKLLKMIPYEGSLLSLFDSREEFRLLLGRTSQNMLHAEVNVKFVTQDGKELSFAIKDSPYRPIQLEDGKIVITSKDKKIIDFKGKLKLLKLDDPSMEPVFLTYNDEEGYKLPEEIRSWGKTLLVGRSRGRICPALIDMSHDMTGEDRWAIRENTIQQITEGLRTSSIGDKLWQRIIGWFHRTQEDDVPASSLLELHCVAKKPSALICLAFQLFAQCDNKDDSELLSEQLKSFSTDLAFSWYWLAPHLNLVMKTINDYIADLNNEVIRTMYIKWAMQQGEKAIDYLGKLTKKDEYEATIGQCIMETINLFAAWMEKLCVDSLVETYDYQTDEFTVALAQDIVFPPHKGCHVDERYTDYIDISQEYINNATSDFFNQYHENGKTGNEDWMLKRVNAVFAHLTRNIDLFAASEEIRRSVIFCRKSCNKQFVISLSNKLANKKYEVR